MTWNATVEKATAVVAEGEFNAEVTGIHDMVGQHGHMVRLEFTLSTDDEWDGRRVSGIASKKLCENTKLGRWVGAILGRMPDAGDDIAEEDLLEKQCRIVIKHKTNADGVVFANVADVLAPKVPF